MTGRLSCDLAAIRFWRACDRAGATCRLGWFIMVLVAAVVLGCGHALAGEDKTDSGPARYRVFSLRHISAENAKEYLARAEIGTVSQLPGANMLLVTAQPGELIKAAAILGLVDAKEPFVMKTLSTGMPAKDFPSQEEIEAAVGDISVGTFFNPPPDTTPNRAIIDVHNGAVLAIAPASQIEQIVSAVQRSQRPAQAGEQIGLEAAKAEQVEQATPEGLPLPSLAEVPASNGAARIAALRELSAQAEAGDSRADQLFNGLLKSLAEAEKKAAEPPQPALPSTVETVEKPHPEPTAPPESRKVEAKPPQEPNLGAILEKLETEAEEGLEAKSEPEKEKVPAKIKKPGEVAGPAPEPAPVQTAQPKEMVEPAKEQVPVKVEEPREPAEPVEKKETPKIEEPNKVAVPVPPARYAPETIPNADAVLDVDLPEKLPLTDFLDFVGKYLQLDFLYDPAQFQKVEVTLRINGELRGEVKVKELYGMLESVLQFHGFAMTRKGNLVTVRLMTEADMIDPPILHPELGKVEAGNVLVTRVFELEHIDPTAAETLLKNMKLGITITPISGTGTLIVTGYAYRMARIEDLLEMIDKPGEPKEFRYRPLKYTMAQTLAPKIKTLVEQLGEISISVAEAQPTPAQQPARGRPPARRPGRPATRTPVRTPAKQPPTAAQPGEPTVYLDFDERTNRVLMIGLKADLDIVEELIESLDVEKQDLRSLRLYEIQHVDADEVRKKLEELGIVSVGTMMERDRRTGLSRRDRGRTTQPPARTGQPPAARTAATATPAGTTTEEPLVEEPQVVIIESINALLVNATPEQHAQVAMIIGYVDSVPEQGVIPYVVYPLENQDPTELATVLNQLVQETTTKQEQDAKIVTTTTTKRTEEDIIIIPDPKTYSLIVYASKKNQQWIKALVDQLDQYRPQVLLDATLVEITKNDRFQLDLDLISKFPEALANAQTPEKVAFFAGRMLDLSSTKGVGDGFYADEHVQVILQAIQTKGYGRILARPKLLVRDNEEGTIKAEKQTTIVSPKSQIVPGQAVGAVSTTATSVELQNYTSGITLTITPHISRGDQLQLKIALNRTDFGKFENYVITTGDDGKIEGPKPPDLLTSDVATVVTVPDNHTVILGGLEKLNQSKGGTKVPLLGDIPLIGGLFRSTLNVEDQSRLYVFVKAHIVRPGEPLDGNSRIEVVSRKNRDTFERYEEEMQRYEDWPGIKPKPMDPVRVLDND